MRANGVVDRAVCRALQWAVVDLESQDPHDFLVNTDRVADEAPPHNTPRKFLGGVNVGAP